MPDNFLSTIAIAKKLPTNYIGNDYVIGDIHGMVDQVEILLEAVSFNEATDRLFLVGDLGDRGPKSVESLRLLLRHYVYSSMGNHEELFLCAVWEYLNEGKEIPLFFECSPSDMYINGGQWIFQEKPSLDWCDKLIKQIPDFREILTAISKLPLILSVGENGNRFNVFHAELDSRWTDAAIDLLPSELPLGKALKKDMGLSLWNKVIFGRDNINTTPLIQDGLSPTFTGHSTGKGIRKALSQICIDTGAYASLKRLRLGNDGYKDYGLTIINTKTWQALTVNAENTIKTSYVPKPNQKNNQINNDSNDDKISALFKM